MVVGVAVKWERLMRLDIQQSAGIEHLGHRMNGGPRTLDMFQYRRTENAIPFAVTPFPHRLQVKGEIDARPGLNISRGPQGSQAVCPVILGLAALPHLRPAHQDRRRVSEFGHSQLPLVER